MRKLPDNVRAEEGRALARLGDGGWDPAVQAGRRAGLFDDELVEAAAELLRGWVGSASSDAAAAGPAADSESGPSPPTWVCAIPSERSGELVPDFARRLAHATGLDYVDALERTGPRPPQREMANSAQQVANVRGAFRVAGGPPPGPGLLVDDIRFSGWTLAMTAGQLRRRGAPAVYPLALTTAF
jgi:ATP-dependent DNA helicase RecQ